MDAPETPHIHGTPITMEPKNLKEFFGMFKALEERVAALEATRTPVDPEPAAE